MTMRVRWIGAGFGLAMCGLAVASMAAQTPSASAPAPAAPAATQANQDESKVPQYTLPDPLMLESGEKVTDVKTWHERRRPELLHLFETQVYGRPAHASKPRFLRTSIARDALGGLATRKEVTVFLDGTDSGPRMNLLVYVPNASAGAGAAAKTGKKPAFLGFNFGGNHTVHADPGITLPTVWARQGGSQQYVSAKADEASRGRGATQWQVENVLKRGYAFVTVYYGDLEPDFPEGWRHGVRSRFHPEAIKEPKLPPKATRDQIAALKAKLPEPQTLDEWGAIGAWAWGMSRALDYLTTDDDIDATKVAVIGHSRIGKATLWAGAQDQRFALVIANESGEGGAALTRRKFGESLTRITTAFPHWFAGMYTYYRDRENDLPVDFHELIALIAPRPVYVASAAEDLWADPRGEFLGAKNAEPVYKLFGKEGLGVDQQPPIDTSVGRTIGYHVRTGKHDVTAFDWEQYLNFADKHLRQ
jgi:hypothetical protein